ncbi:hypothetical protein DYB35_001814 [Aphanomyces astaci]|uniref:Uncharacterized protein n=1 Tax=Aphanomyces astaci TaxID=112090 RepID=A0A418DKU1_APHAT|nr:hypothetical protein DYB35_001814 [Aphanomyces astaci]
MRARNPGADPCLYTYEQIFQPYNNVNRPYLAVPDYPGPGQYPTNEITTAFNTVKDYSIQNIPDVRPRPETPGPGQYTSNYGAVMASQTFDDYFRTAPLKNLSTCQVKIKQITREIKQLKYKKALALPSLPVEKQKAMCNETFDLVQALLLEKAALEADEAEARQLANPRARATTRFVHRTWRNVVLTRST